MIFLFMIISHYFLLFSLIILASPFFVDTTEQRERKEIFSLSNEMKSKISSLSLDDNNFRLHHLLHFVYTRWKIFSIIKHFFNRQRTFATKANLMLKIILVKTPRMYQKDKIYPSSKDCKIFELFFSYKKMLLPYCQH